MELSKWDAMAVLAAMEKAVKGRMAELRAECDGDLIADYDERGVQKRALKVGGRKVGEIAVTYNRPGFAATDRAALGEFALEYGFAREQRSIRPEYMGRAIDLIEAESPEAVETEVVLDKDWTNYMTLTGSAVTYLDSGAVVPGVEFVPESVKGTRVTGCKPEDVVPLVREMGGIDQLLLGGAE